VVRERELGEQFKSFDELATRGGLKEEALRNLALVGAFDSCGEARRALLWRARDAHRTAPSLLPRAPSPPPTSAPPPPQTVEHHHSSRDIPEIQARAGQRRGRRRGRHASDRGRRDLGDGATPRCAPALREDRRTRVAMTSEPDAYFLAKHVCLDVDAAFREQD